MECKIPNSGLPPDPEPTPEPSPPPRRRRFLFWHNQSIKSWDNNPCSHYAGGESKKVRNEQGFGEKWG